MSYPTQDEPKPHSKLGIASFLCFVLVLLFLALAIVLAIVAGNQSGEYSKILIIPMVACFFLAPLSCLLGIGLGIAGVTNRNRRKIFAVLGLAFNGILLLGVLLALLQAAGFIPDADRKQTLAKARIIRTDIELIDKAAQLHAVTRDLATLGTVSFDELVQTGYFGKDHALSQGRPSIPLPPHLTYGVLFREIDPTRKLQVPPELRNLFTPTVATDDRLWDR